MIATRRSASRSGAPSPAYVFYSSDTGAIRALTDALATRATSATA